MQRLSLEFLPYNESCKTRLFLYHKSHSPSLNNTPMQHLTEIKIFRSPFLFFIRMLLIMFSIKTFILIVILSFGLSQWLLFASMFFELCIVCLLFITWSTDYYKITQSKIIHKRWVLVTRQDDFNLDIIDNIKTTQTLLWRMFNYWNLTLNFWQKEYILRDIHNPKYFIFFNDKIIKKYKDESNSQ